MSRGFSVRLSLTAVAVASIAVILLQSLGVWSGGVLPFDVVQQSNGLYVVHRDNNFPLPSSFIDGDVVAPREMTSAARAATFYGVSVQVGTQVGIAVVRGGRVVHISVTAQPALPLRRDLLGRLITAFLNTPFLAALALLTLWRGRDRVAAGLCALALYGLTASALLSLGNVLSAPLVTGWLVLIAVEAQYFFALPGLYVMAEGLAGAGMSARTRLLARVLVACLGIAALVLDVTREVSATSYGIPLSPAVSAAVQALTLTLIAIPVVMLFAGYRRAPHESRLRIRWVLWSTAFLLACALAVFALEPVQSRYPYLFEFVYTARLLCMGGYLYAAIRTRLVDVSFVVNRALVYAAITALLFGVFSVLELGLHEFAVSDKLSWALQAIVALLLAMALSPLHRRLDHWVERFFFRKQRLAIATLRNFAAECAFIEQQSRLLATAVERFQRHCDAVAIYERALAGYQLRGSSGRAWPEAVDVDDPAFVSLRARRQELDLHGLDSGMGFDGLVFPMIVGEMLSGAVVCRPRAGEQFAPDVRAALAEAAHNLGASLYILRYREQARLVADIATGRIDETDARQRAIAMLEGTA
ncbi:MAG TPA: hypothetical protein VHY36_00830 [Steroidobacteraceae bacterium]|jgi:hypothetical protein|nr:hypothetical protein [Steroidobacteraceae bacterium]